jgi:pimeloyl-ACP methyl ester carboxylesterase
MEWKQTGDVIANGVRLRYYRTGQGQRPVVLCHGVTDSGECWPRVVPVLAAKYDVITYDARGHGRSEIPHAPFAQADQAADLKGLCEVLGLVKPAIIGHSMGAATASTAEMLFPGLAACLVLEDPPWRDPASISRAGLDSYVARLEGYQRSTLEELIAAGQARSPRWGADEFPGWAAAKQLVQPVTLKMMQPSSLGWRDVARGIQCPTLLITGNPDYAKEAGLGGIIVEAIAREAQQIMAAVQVVNVPEAGHNIRREGYESYMATVSAFLAHQYPA